MPEGHATRPGKANQACGANSCGAQMPEGMQLALARQYYIFVYKVL